MTEEIVHGKVIAKKDGIYTIYVFQLDNGEYKMCTKLPNWGAEYNLSVGDTGFMSIQYFQAGETYFDRKNNNKVVVKFTNAYFKEFIKDNLQTDNIIL